VTSVILFYNTRVQAETNQVRCKISQLCNQQIEFSIGKRLIAIPDDFTAINRKQATGKIRYLIIPSVIGIVFLVVFEVYNF
jgi:hypothetical protein